MNSNFLFTVPSIIITLRKGIVMPEYKTLGTEAIGELIEKKSRFIATVRPVSSEAEAVEFIAEMKKKYWDARHNCSAYIISSDESSALPAVLERCSDDGEPSRTAGMPMLDVLKGAGLQNVCCVVTRYFGGILLGTGGLVRAYQGAVQDALAHAAILTRKYLNRVSVTVDYTAYDRVRYIAEQDGLHIESTDFSGDVTIVFLLTDDALEALSAKVTEVTSGGCLIDIEDKVWAEI